ncbi:hypothetical protein EJ110_NYTH19743 [Nymphaea thermarum]|nr:hypothetical protein EJ110_NYTH19743 [Nymphaea thermarum]
MADPNRPESMKVLGRIGDRQVLVLLDSGATHNFIGDYIATQLSCTMEEQPTLRVLVANGDILSCTHKRLPKPVKIPITARYFRGDEDPFPNLFIRYP